ncbi:MAG: trypsin-like peptidase domain-containing protein [Bacilli bacterium]|nr:trypsin-like peptidase domain-containing protein [Bacilli bacterium]
MGIFGTKKPTDKCPICGQKLFMENPDGTRTCAKCGFVIGKKEGGLARYDQKTSEDKPSSAKTASCPNCGQTAELFSIEGDGTEIYRCSFCDNRFQKKIKAPKEPIAPAKKEPDVLDGKGVFDLAKANTVEVHAVFGQMGAAGSGFFFERGLLLTNAHVISDHENGWKLANKVTINYKGGKRYEAQVVAYNTDHDMALLVTEMPCTKVAKIADKVPETGVTIYAVGNTKGEGMCILEGIVADSERMIDDLPFMMISANTFHGNSGGPVFNDKGEVVGILTLGDREVVSMNYAIPVTRIHAFIDVAKKSLAKQIAARGGR